MYRHMSTYVCRHMHMNHMNHDVYDSYVDTSYHHMNHDSYDSCVYIRMQTHDYVYVDI